MRVLHVSTRREWRGGEVQLLHLLDRGGGVLAAPPDGALFARFAGERRAVGFRGPFFGGPLASIARDLAPDLVCAHDANASRHVARLGRPWVAHRRIDDVPSRRHAALLARAAGVVAVSDAVADVLRRVGVRRVRVVADGVDPPPGDPDRAGVRAELGLPDGAPLVLAVGALVPHKDHATLARALRELPRVHAAVLGEGRERARLAGVERLHLPGHRADVGRWLRSADLLVHPSRTEGLGQAVLEALAVGLPAVVSDAGGLVGIDGVAARFPRGDAPALAAAVRRHLGTGPRPPRPADAGRMVDETRAAWTAFLG